MLPYFEHVKNIVLLAWRNDGAVQTRSGRIRGVDHQNNSSVAQMCWERENFLLVLSAMFMYFYHVHRYVPVHALTMCVPYPCSYHVHSESLASSSQYNNIFSFLIIIIKPDRTQNDTISMNG